MFCVLTSVSPSLPHPVFSKASSEVVCSMPDPIALNQGSSWGAPPSYSPAWLFFVSVTLQVGPSFHMALTEVCAVQIPEASGLWIPPFILLLLKWFVPIFFISLVIPLKTWEVEDMGNRWDFVLSLFLDYVGVCLPVPVAQYSLLSPILDGSFTETKTRIDSQVCFFGLLLFEMIIKAGSFFFTRNPSTVYPAPLILRLLCLLLLHGFVQSRRDIISPCHSLWVPWSNFCL